jgi:hypothetical protein
MPPGLILVAVAAVVIHLKHSKYRCSENLNSALFIPTMNQNFLPRLILS